jgi:hypothetical protein
VGRCGWGRKVHRQDFEKKLAIRPVSSYVQKTVGTGSAAGGCEPGAPALTREIALAQAYPVGIAPAIERRWHLCDSGPLPQSVGDDSPGQGRCRVCSGMASIAPASSEYRGKGIIHHHWQCSACGEEWVTVVHVPL